jgi:hypothetical protein
MAEMALQGLLYVRLGMLEGAFLKISSLRKKSSVIKQSLLSLLQKYFTLRFIMDQILSFI